MVVANEISAAQFVTAIIAIAAALTGWVTLILANRRLRAERAIPVIQRVEGTRSGGCRIVIENVGSRPALDIVVSIGRYSRLVAGGLRSGERIEIIVAEIGEVVLAYRDATGSERRIGRFIAEEEAGLVLTLPPRSGLPGRLLVRSGFIAPT